MKALRIVLACGVFSLTGCVEFPTFAESPVDPILDGFGFGSGHRTAPDSTSNEFAAGSDEVAAEEAGDQEGESKSGFGFGSGH